MIKWFHQIPLPEGITNGVDQSLAKLNFIDMPNVLGKTVLDLGAWDGYFSFAAEKLGATRVLAVDTDAWQKKEFGSWKNGTMKEGFEYARLILNSKVEDKEVELVDISEETVGKFDVVLCLGILYHMENPMQIIKNVFNVTNEVAVFETQGDCLELNYPAMRFYGKERMFNNDQTNFWGMNPQCLLAMLGEVGFKQARIVGFDNNSRRLAVHAFK